MLNMPFAKAHTRTIHLYYISYSDSRQCIWAHIHGLYSSDHEVEAEGLYAPKSYIWAHINCQ